MKELNKYQVIISTVAGPTKGFVEAESVKEVVDFIRQEYPNFEIESIVKEYTNKL